MVNSSLKYQLGQKFLLGFDGLQVTSGHPVITSIQRDNAGGVILFDRDFHTGRRKNILSPAQLQSLTTDLQKQASIFLLIAVDQEGGRVCRLKESDGFPTTLTNARLGRQKTVTSTQKYAQKMAASLSRCGINLNLAPVVDLNTNPNNPVIGKLERSFGLDAAQVAQHASEFIKAHHQAGVACSLKHFPGHGSSDHDSHRGFVDITDTWNKSELEPFAQLIKAGLADSIMTAHVFHRQLDPTLPATLSPIILPNLLRNQLRFKGVIISDDLQMRAISDRWTYKEAVQKAVLAGVDLLIIGNNLSQQQDAVREGVRAIIELLETNAITEEKLTASLRRINRLKQKIGGKIPW